ncbi:DUF3509 domain-containing protein [Pseudomonas mangiferae]|uniref:DUF3509 domain-containing protein n=1 Tax=Pseudomonas mangiferae TaxID=2593654 RepID=A0A553GW53_9PSED|nr:DUF3509 domain-containing protein [Pseudomonas mangiferae]TRX73719.1 DUF3509 domain-containing protein [Pseudomonas mangiferae]
MNIDFATIEAAFPDYNLSVSPRPDGSHLLTLLKDGELHQRVVPAPHSGIPMRTEWVISAIRRDLDLETGRVPTVADLQSQARRLLPTYAPNTEISYERRVDRVRTRYTQKAALPRYA